MDVKKLAFETVRALEEQTYTPHQIVVIRDMETDLKKDFGWIYAESEKVREVAIAAGFGRSLSGSRQKDWLLRRIYCAQEQHKDDPNLVRTKIFEAAKDHFSPSREEFSELEQFPAGHFFDMVKRLGGFLDRHGESPNHIEFFKAIADRLKYIRDFKPAQRDFAIEAVQEAFVGLMETKYAWGTEGLPTKGEVISMAKAGLKQNQQTVPKGGWTKMLKDGGLDFLPEGKAGRPSKAQVDENLKAKQQVLSTITKLVNEGHGGDWHLMLLRVQSSSGGKKAALQNEQERLDAQYRSSKPIEEEDETE
jgi:hypothetical protein